MYVFVEVIQLKHNLKLTTHNYTIYSPEYMSISIFLNYTHNNTVIHYTYIQLCN